MSSDARDMGATGDATPQVDGPRRTLGATATLTRSLSEADLALFALVTGEAEVSPDARLATEPRFQRAAPPALLAALLAASAAQHADPPAWARFVSAEVRFIEPAYADDTVRASATITAIDTPSGALHVSALCESADGRRLAEAEFLLRAS